MNIVFKNDVPKKSTKKNKVTKQSSAESTKKMLRVKPQPQKEKEDNSVVENKKIEEIEPVVEDKESVNEQPSTVEEKESISEPQPDKCEDKEIAEPKSIVRDREVQVEKYRINPIVLVVATLVLTATAGIYLSQLIINKFLM